jgi:lipid A ethanolaminephosphotransferase
MNQSKIIVFSAIFLMLFANQGMYHAVTVVYPINGENFLFLLSLFVVFTAANIFLFGLLCFKSTIKWVLGLIFICSSQAAYFMDTYNVVIDDTMLENALATDTAETLDLLSLQQVLYFLLLGVLPTFLVARLEIKTPSLGKALLQRAVLLLVSLGVIAVCVVSMNGFYASFIREHKQLRFYANPSYYIYSVVNLVKGKVAVADKAIEPRGLDAEKMSSSSDRRLIVVVVGETTRADHFGINGYERQTTPLLVQQSGLYSYRDVWSCGTSTAFSVPCMFALEGMEDYDKDEAKYIENSLDIAARVGSHVVWIDNNSNSKGVADRVEFLNYKTPENNPVCDEECRDVGMIPAMREVIDNTPDKDIVVILHQMGNHGPAYYKRYPAEFEKYKPVCTTNQLEQCPTEHIVNAYDNVILYTDYFLNEVIETLKQYEGQFETAMFYAGDHGESLGENNLYLHGLPYAFAPDEQKHVPMFLWLGDSLAQHYDGEKILQSTTIKTNHDVMSHTILGLLQIQTQDYRNEWDLLSEAKK